MAPALVFAALKGRWVLFVLGIIAFPFAFIGALLPARANSPWARRHEAELKNCSQCGDPADRTAQVCASCGHRFRARAQLFGPERLVR